MLSRLWRCIWSSTGRRCPNYIWAITGKFPSQRPVTRSFDVFFYLRLNKRLVNNWYAGDLRRHCAHHDVTVMTQQNLVYISWDMTSWDCFPLKKRSSRCWFDMRWRSFYGILLWNGNVVVSIKFSPQAALDGAKIKLSCAAIDKKFVKVTTFPFHCDNETEISSFWRNFQDVTLYTCTLGSQRFAFLLARTE